MPYPCAAYASVAYVDRRGCPDHPCELADHDCLVSLLHGKTWHFYGDQGDVGLTVRPRLSVNDTIVLREAVRRGLGVAILPSFLAQDDLSGGGLRQVLSGYRPPPMWIKAQIPTQKVAKPSVNALLHFLTTRLRMLPTPADNAPRTSAAAMPMSSGLVLHANGLRALGVNESIRASKR
jgi:DNA-binding transcriptional LysR family regulator